MFSYEVAHYGKSSISVLQEPHASIDKIFILTLGYFLWSFDTFLIFPIFVTLRVLTLLLPVPTGRLMFRSFFEQEYLQNGKRTFIFFTRMFFKEYLISILMVSRVIDFTLVILKFMFEVCGINGIPKINFSGTQRVIQNRNILKTIQKLSSL